MGFANPAPGQDATCRAEVFVLDSLSKHPEVVSPDGRYRLVLSGDENSDVASARVYRGKKLLREVLLEDLSAGIFVKWAPDSKAFFVMWSNGGMIGGYSVRVFRVHSDSIAEVPTIQTAEREFKRRHDCKTRGINVFAVKWHKDSTALLIATEVYPTGDCGDEMGVVRGYIVATENGAIRSRLSESQIKAEMKQCPSEIWPTALWDDKTLQSAKAKVREKH